MELRVFWAYSYGCALFYFQESDGAIIVGFVNVKFLGQDYQVSEAINEFRDYDEILTPNREKILSTLSQDVKNSPYSWSFNDNTPDLVYNNAAKYQQIMEDCATVLVNKLYELGVYDVSSDEMLKQTTGIQELIDLRDVSLQTMLSEGKKYIELKNMGLERAYKSAASQITGSGWMVFSSSITTLMINSFVENSILKSQAKQADKEYQKAVQVISTCTTHALDKMVREVMIKQYYPSLIDILMKFPTSLTAMFLTILSERGKFDFNSIKQYDMDKAETMLNNINRVPDKVEFLKQVFAVCPFCFQLYEICLNEGLLDIDTFSTAKYFGFSDSLIDSVKSYCIKNSDDYSKIKTSVEMYSSFTGKSITEVLNEIYKDKIHIVRKHYNELNKAISNRRSLADWINKCISRNAIDFCKMERGKIKQLFINSINRIGIPYNTVDILLEKGLICTSSLSQNRIDATSIKEVNEYYYSNIETALFNYLDELKDHVDCCLSEASIKKADYEAKEKAYLDKINEYRNREKSLQQERDKLGLFAFSKKKELNSKISACVSERESFEKSENPYQIKDEIDRLYREAKEYI